jgi:apolipoprotein N-acyltransferase
MDRLAHAVILSWGWRRRGIAFAAGALSSLAQPPFFLFPVLWITFPVLVWLLDGAVTQGRFGRVRRLAPAFATGWLFGFGYFLAGLWWIGAAFLVEADTFGWLMPLAVVALPAGLAMFWGLAAVGAQLLWSEDYRRIFALAAALGGAEWLRAHLFLRLPVERNRIRAYRRRGPDAVGSAVRHRRAWRAGSDDLCGAGRL